MSVLPDRLMMSVDGYFALEVASPETRYEYLDGYAMLRSADSITHALISTHISAILSQALHDSPCLVFGPDAHVKLSDTRYVYPDVSASCAEQHDDNPFSVAEPAVMGEVFAPSTLIYDRTEKLHAYRECPSMQAILLAEQTQPLVEVHRRQSKEVWTVQIYRMDEQIVLDAIGVTIPVAEIYRRVTFTS